MSLVSVTHEGDLAVVTIDNPPVSTGNTALRTALFDAFTGLAEKPGLTAIVVHSAQAHFYSGSDIKEFDGPVQHPLLTEVIEVMESLEVPIVAALNGLTLGGGLEFALACDERIATTDSKLGLPEVSLGFMPGAGGTVRLPRLIGTAAAIDIIASAKPVGARQALELGLVDEVVEQENLMATAVARAKNAVRRRIVLMEHQPDTDQAALDAVVEKYRSSPKTRPNVLRAIDFVLAGVGKPGPETVKQERLVFDELRVAPEARNLRYLFFAARAAAKDFAIAKPKLPIRRVGVAGAGTMGSGIAEALLGAGLEVVLYEVNAEVLENAGRRLETASATARKWGELSRVSDLAAFADVDLVIDAVFEDMAVKQQLLRDLEPVVSADTVLATNTSYLDLNEMAEALEDRTRFVGLHFFNPANRNPLVEVVRAEQTSDEAIGAMAAIAKTLRKTPILAGVADGFVANRVYSDYRMQAEYLVEDGASPRQVDDAMRALGLPVGPFAVGDMSGLDIAWARRKRLAATRNPEQRYATIADTLCEQGRLGKKTGAGWYLYSDEAPRGAEDPKVALIIDRAREAKGISPRTISREEIQQRIICAMLVAAAGLVESGVANRASDIDLAFTEGFAFPRWLGGPIRYAAAQSDEWLGEGLRLVGDSDPIGFSLAAGSEEAIPPKIRRVLDEVGR